MSFNNNQNIFNELQNSIKSPISLLFIELSNTIDSYFDICIENMDIKITTLLQSNAYLFIKVIDDIVTISEKYGFNTYLDVSDNKYHIKVTKKL